MSRAFLLVIDSFGIGAAPDAAEFGDAGSDTLGHIAQACAEGRADREGLRSGPLSLPFLGGLGLGRAAQLVTGSVPPGLPERGISGLYAAAFEQSRGKDTPSGHWEMAGVPVMFEWGYFPPEYPSFPQELVDELVKRAKLPGILGNSAASGTEIIERLGKEHMNSGKPICYTSADSVFQIACHEKTFGLERLYKLCHIARELVDPYNIGRVIARPFIGDDGEFERTANRHDYSVPPPEPTLLDKLQEAGREVVSIGKIADIFAHRGLTKKVTAAGTDALCELCLEEARTAPDGSLIFVNLVDFDSVYGHRRDVAGYAAALESLDRRLYKLEAELKPGDLVCITADHGCDPTWQGTDHTREHVPVLVFGPGMPTGSAGVRETFADIGQTVAAHLGIEPLKHGTRLY
ncbi:phosphopentomutase [Salidesulfovibrio onnuriiensis]|uniref:phosphopentomutase n=1 Tax=Salidesulfovibrio onnuriiensis TaxID=2583823 RepID=UPI0011CA9CD5|nr:phosphopentomutase [Salidesulfovibrio onnuriiensis]